MDDTLTSLVLTDRERLVIGRALQMTACFLDALEYPDHTLVDMCELKSRVLGELTLEGAR